LTLGVTKSMALLKFSSEYILHRYLTKLGIIIFYVNNLSYCAILDWVISSHIVVISYLRPQRHYQIIEVFLFTMSKLIVYSDILVKRWSLFFQYNFMRTASSIITILLCCTTTWLLEFPFL
jgi:hypothetical protein